MGRWEWIIVLVVVVAALIAELISVRRSIARAKRGGSEPAPRNPER